MYILMNTLQTVIELNMSVQEKTLQKLAFVQKLLHILNILVVLCSRLPQMQIYSELEDCHATKGVTP